MIILALVPVGREEVTVKMEEKEGQELNSIWMKLMIYSKRGLFCLSCLGLGF